MLVVAGEVRERFGARIVTARQGDILFRPAGETHTHDYGSAGAHCIVTLFEAGAALPGRGVTLVQDTTEHREFLSELESGDDAILGVQSSVAALVQLVSFASERGVRYGMPRWLRDVRDFIHDQVDHRSTLAEITRATGIHEGHLTRAFRAHFGCSVGEYARRVRIRRAARKLLRSDAPLADIALDAAFCDQSHFNRVFRRIVGMTPGEMRKRGLSKQRTRIGD